MTIRDLRQRWPEAEAALKLESEILVTRDSKPVAKLVYITDADARRPRWNVKSHARWQKRVSEGKISRSDEALAKSRADRTFSGRFK
jgi:antitoxin (DNA-binding transcriptional repressor) of toxin-antitoxin stability system